ncbi:MAG: baseplate J/gp47 family protein [Proteobacteria bacterium]|nr:baseplate J/gp47 family protein [Pseudomonadota bacterium]
MKPLKFRSGTNQNDRFKSSLQPEYISVEERSTLDLLKYSRDYARKVRFYDLNGSAGGFWSSFLSLVDDEEKASLSDNEIKILEDERLAELAEFAENPENFQDEPKKLDRFSKPHLTLLLAFIRLIKHPKNQFASLTQKHLEYFYRDVLNLNEKDEIPDQVHVIFRLARDVNESLLKKGVLLSAGKDATGVDLQYEAQEDIVLNKSEVTDIKTIHFNKATTDLKFVHLQHDRGDEGFEKILTLVINQPALPPYINDYGTELSVDVSFLRTELYDRIKGKERDELPDNDAAYIFESLFFPYLKDFWTCLDVFYREMNRGYVGITIPEETEWEEVYDILEGVHNERIARSRRQKLKEIHKTRGFEVMMEHAFGVPEPGNLLFAMPGNISTLDELALSETEAARKYIENHLCMSADDFRIVMRKKDKSLGDISGDEVYTLLEIAWTKKRNFQYPTIDSDYIEGYYADTVFESDKDSQIERFSTFGKSTTVASSENIKMGFAVGSPLLFLNEGQRTIEALISAQEGSINHNRISQLLKDNPDIFNIYLSTKIGWQPVQDYSVEVGKFITKSPVRSFSEKYSHLVCDTLRFNILNEESKGWYINFDNNQVYEIVEYDYFNNKIHLSSVYIWFETDATKLITALIPKTFVDPLNGDLDIDIYTHSFVHTLESFSDYHEGKYLVDGTGKIFYIHKFIEADAIEVRYCGYVPEDLQSDPMITNRVWESIEPEYAVSEVYTDISDLKISEMISNDQDYRFEVNDRKLRIQYPIDPTGALNANDLLDAWKKWSDVPENDAGRFEVSTLGTGDWRVQPFTKQIELTGETIKRYESLEAKGLKVTYRGRPTDQVFLAIQDRDLEKETCSFLVAGGILTITPGRSSFTANQVAADWQNWLKDTVNNNPQGFQVETKDTHQWEVVPRENMPLPILDLRIKYTEIRNLYGNGIRVSYTGPESDQPKLILKENEIDLFDFEVVQEQQLVIKYPFMSATSAHDLVEEWKYWCNSELNDPGKFDIWQLGDGLWEIKAQQQQEFQGLNNQILECFLRDVVPVTETDNEGNVKQTGIEIKYDIGVIAMYRLTGTYVNAIIELRQASSTEAQFQFIFSDVPDDLDKTTPVAKKLEIIYPKLPVISDDVEIQREYQVRHVQKLLNAWNRLPKKHNFFLIKREDEATWTAPATYDPDQDKIILETLPDPYIKDFLQDLTYLATVHPDGFKVKYQPMSPFHDLFDHEPAAILVLEEGDPLPEPVDLSAGQAQDEKFTFRLKNDYPEDRKYLFIHYPTDRSQRTVEKLISDWDEFVQGLINSDTEENYLAEFTIEQSGTGKWEISAQSDIPLTTNTTPETPKSDEAYRRFFSYGTKDVNGFTINYAGPIEVSPDVTFIETEIDDFSVEVQPVDLPFYSETFERSLIIRYPARKDKRKLIGLFKAWNEWKETNGQNLDQGFEIVDTTPVVEKRYKSPLLKTGDKIREFIVDDNGLRFTYIGHRKLVDLEVTPILDFTDDDIGKKVMWENGEIFDITERFDSNTVTINTAGSIERYDSIQQYDPEAVCLNALKFTAFLDYDFPAVLPDPDNPISSNPMLQVLFNNNKEFTEKSSEAIYYDAFNSILLEKVDLKVDVKGLRQVKTRGNLAMINPQNHYQPFGATPERSAKFYFANREICEKTLDSININLHWKDNEFMTDEGIPDMEAHYYSYSRVGLESAATIKNRDFEVDLQFKDRRSWMNVSKTPRQLFQQTLSYDLISGQTYQGILFSEDDDLPKDPLDWQRYYKLELGDQGFMGEVSSDVFQSIADASNRLLIAESEYNNIKQEIVSREASIRSAKINEAEARAAGETYLPPVIPEARALPALPENDKDLNKLTFVEAYSPFIQGITIDYTATSSAFFAEPTDKDRSLEVPLGFYRYHPFGYSEMGQLSHDEDDYLLPHYSKQGYFNIGVSNIKPLQTLSLLIQMVSGSGDAHKTIPNISWSYLASNKWLSFEESHILKDTTFGLQDTGIVRFVIPEDATIFNTVMPSERCWIRAEAQENITAVPDVIDVQSQAILAQYVNNNNDPNHLESPLMAETISELVERDSAIREVMQPFSSFKGKKTEESSEFYARISERLKHKQRALTLGDYENLILAKFSEIYKVKVLPQGELKILDSKSEGKVVIVVILKNKNATPFFPLKPKTPANILGDIEKYIKDFMPPLVSVRVVNPRFEEVQYRLAVKFAEGYDFGFYINQLNQDIKQFLSPWAYSQDADISFGSSIYSSSVINHIENTEYVDYVANFTLLRQIITHEDYTETIPLFLTKDNAATTKYPDSILVSAEDHIIDVIHTDLYDAAAFRGIGYMKIGTDFWISRPGPVFSVGIGEMELEEWPVRRYAFTQIGVTVTITGTVDGTNYTKDFTSVFSQKDSQRFWDQLKEGKYIDAKGNVLSISSLYTVSFGLKFQDEVFSDYMNAHQAEFDFGLDLKASDFVTNPDDEVVFSFQIDQIKHLNIIEEDIIDILKEAIGFSGLSQFPFIVY